MHYQRSQFIIIFITCRENIFFLRGENDVESCRQQR